MIHVLSEKASPEQIEDMLQELGSYIKLAVDIRLGVLAGGGAMHADCESALLEAGSQQENVWGASWLPVSEEILFRSQINTRQRNRSMTIQEPEVRKRIESIVGRILGGRGEEP
ncbi:MAG TPA: DUF5674 family protein [Armatimonadota bacterium]|nr:DUF5674 family protein [Armatimonadota bacterium]